MTVNLKGNERKLIFYDFEVLSRSINPTTGKPYWCVVFIDFDTRKGKVIRNDVEELRAFHRAFKNDIFIGYNCRGYDQYILKGLLLGFDAGYINDRLIVDKIKGHNVVREAYKIPFNNFDIMPNPPVSLKTLESFMGSEIEESSVPFSIERPITEEEERDLIKYCVHDVKETIKVFEAKREEFDSQLQLIEAFDLDMKMFTKTKAQLSAHILDAKKQEDRGDEFNFIYPDTLQLDKYQYVKDWYDNFNSYTDSNGKEMKLETEVAGVPTVYGIGGIHSAIKNIDESGIILACDISSMYPALIIEYGLMSRNVPSVDKYVQIRNERLKLKAERNPKQQPLKIVLNATFGTFKDQYNAMVDKLMSNSICVTGQLLLTDLAEKLEAHCKILQKNTDGIYMKVEKEEDIEIVKSIAKEWEQRTRLDLEWDRYERIIQKDVNNYILVPKGDLYYDNGDPRWKAKGGVVKLLDDLDYNMAVVNRAVTQYFLSNTPIADTINNCDELRDFQQVSKLTAKYDNALYGCTFSKKPVFDEKTGKSPKKEVWNEDGELLQNKTFRVFASTREEDGGIFKHKVGSKPQSFADTSEKCFIDNSNIVGKKTPDYLDREFYIDLAQRKLNLFLGIKNKPKKKKVV